MRRCSRVATSRMVARLRPGVDIASANAELSVVSRDIVRAHPKDYAHEKA